MQKIINGKKYDTKTAELVVVYKNKWLLKYEMETGEEFVLPRDEVKQPAPDNPFRPGMPVIPKPDIPGDEIDPDDPYKPVPLDADLSEDEYEDLDDPDTPRQDPDPKEEEEPEEEPEDDGDEDDDPEEDEPGADSEDPTEDEPETGEEPEVPKLSPRWKAELLYRKANGKYFVYGVGGGASEYWNDPFGEFKPLDSEVEAIEWAVTHLPVSMVEKVFGEFGE